nr:MAG TPA: hypothetical protein [Caudoviricetes sp.]
MGFLIFRLPFLGRSHAPARPCLLRRMMPAWIKN